MDCSEARLDKIEAQRLTGVSHDTESAPDFLANLRLSDLYNLPGEYVVMHPEIFSAMRTGNREYFERMKSYKTPIICLKNEPGDSVLHLAAAWGHLELVKSIVSECPSLLLDSNWKGQLPLHVAARAGHSVVVEALVLSVTFFAAKFSEEDREKLNLYVLKDEDGNTSLHLAMKDLYEKTELLRYQKRSRKPSLSLSPSTHLMETAACLVSANQRASFLANKDGMSPLYLAVEAGNVSLVNTMLNRSGDNFLSKTFNLSSQLQGRKSLVHAALKAKSTDVLEVILNEDPSLLNERDEEGRTCLSVGASIGYYKGICMVLDRSTKSVYECDKDGSFPIHMAVEKGHNKVVKEILKRCPDSVVLINKQGQNIFHIAAKNGKAVSYLLGYIKRLDTKYHLIKEQDVDGNTPLHLATINWRPRTVDNITSFASTKTNILNIQNKDGLRPLDIAELNLQSDYVLHERLTLMVLLCVYAPRGAAWLPTSGMTLRSRSEHLDANKYKDHINALLLVAALVATVTFAAGFTIPGGFNSSAPNMGMAVLAYDSTLFFFLVLDTLAMQSSVVAIVALIWAQLGDPAIVHRAFHLALPSLFIALVSMSWAFVAALQATIKQNSVLINVISITSMVFYGLIIFLLAPYVIPQVPGIPFLQRLTRVYLIVLLFFVNEDDSERHNYTSGFGNTCVKRVVESVGSSGADQVGQSKVP